MKCPRCQHENRPTARFCEDCANPLNGASPTTGSYEEKVGGWRVLAYKDGERVRLVSRNGVDPTRRFRDIAAAIATLRAHARARR
jgi:ATP-dependent DNA ligase